MSIAAIGKWLQRYRQHGEKGLKDCDHRPAQGRLPQPIRDKILELKKEEPIRGIKRISQLLRRVFFLPASAQTVRKTLRQEGLIESPPKLRRNLVRPRFFERATPNQMWQTDIFTFRLGSRYAYLIGFMDDYSRFMVGVDLFRSHTADNVLEVFRVTNNGGPTLTMALLPGSPAIDAGSPRARRQRISAELRARGKLPSILARSNPASMSPNYT